MSKLTDNSLFMFPPLSKHARFYQELIRGIKSYHQLGNRLIELGEKAHAFRQFKQVGEIGLVLSSIPIKEYQTIGYYFLAVAANNNGNGNQQHAKKLYEIVADNATGKYKGKAILSLAAVSCNTKDYESQLYYLIETLKTPSDLSTLVRSRIGIAIYKSVEGFHKQSLKDLENLYPLARLSEPIVFFDYLNSLAVELGEVGRKYEARNVIKHVLESPFIIAYPEWRETAEELKGPNRSSVVIDPSPARMGKLLSMPPVEHAETATKDRPASVINLQDWKKKMGKDKNGDDEQKIEDLSPRQIMLRIMQIVSQPERTDKELEDMLRAMEKIVARKKDK